ncbi:ureidoglycolate hydrolase [Tothia fuscella]|uniref:Ureidoglycolate hydrolase n=1 Tax=Tothia fuscella TaxID=1048955 RepID=A0A9P4NY25_9PEZI|nr:ureidoglycolate hydrolase [Tothia fuscella]
MPSSIPSPARSIPIEPLSSHTFSPFGQVIQNPSLSPHPTKNAQTTANQGTALKYIDVANLIDYYPLAPSKKPARAVINMFVCSPRKLRVGKRRSGEGNDGIHGDGKKLKEKMVFDVKILERHPFTSQTFIPVGVGKDDKSTRYLVIVAPTLQISKSRNEVTSRPKAYPTPEILAKKKSLFDIFSHARPSPYTNEKAPPQNATRATPNRPKGPGLPDLSNIRAFIADGSQAVTYGAGTWHAPMVVLGEKDIAFVVVQYANDVALEDCQEVELKGEGAEEGLAVVVDLEPHELEKRGKLKAKL